MTKPPRDQDEHMVNKSTAVEVGFQGIFMGLLAFINYYIFVSGKINGFSVDHPLYARATTITYLTIVICQYINIMSRRYKFVSLFNRNFFNNKKMIYSLIISIILVITVVYTPINSYLEFSPLLIKDWLLVLGAGFLFLLNFEIIKWYKRRNNMIKNNK